MSENRGQATASCPTLPASCGDPPPLSESLPWEQNRQLLLQIDRPAPVQVDFSTDGSTLTILAPEALGLQLRVLAPLAQEVTFNGSRLAFRRDGDYCVIPLSALRPAFSRSWAALRP